MTSVIDAQCQSACLKNSLKQFNSSKVKPEVDDMLQLLVEVSPSFSVAHLCHDIMQFLRSFLKVSVDRPEKLDAILHLLVTKFECSFRPLPRDVLELCKLYATDNPMCLGKMLVLLHRSLMNQQGNFKLVFALITDGFMPFIDTLSASALTDNGAIVEKILGEVFSCDSVSKKPKMDSCKKIVTALKATNTNTLLISRMLLKQFVLFNQTEGFAFFLQLLTVSDSVHLGLWETVSELQIYEVRGSDVHRSALEEFYNRSVGSPINWAAILVVLKVDPVNFTDRILLLPKCTEEVQNYLFQMHASKGSLADIVLSWEDAQIPKSLEISPLDFVATLKLVSHKESLLISLLQNESLAFLGANLRPEVAAILESSLAGLEKPHKHCTLVLALVDAIRAVKIAWLVPTKDQDSNPAIASALTAVARKSKEFRAEALVRLAVLNECEVSAAELMECANFQAVFDFFSKNLRNESCLQYLFPTISGHNESSSNTNSSEPDVDGMAGNWEVLLQKTEQLISKFGRQVSVPPILRKNDFPLEIVAIESVWSRMDQGVIPLLTEQNSEASLYGLAILLEHNSAERIDKRISVRSCNNPSKDSAERIDIPINSCRLLLAMHANNPSKETAEQLVLMAAELLNGERDLPTVQCAYYALFAGITTERDKRKVRLPWWTNKVHVLLPALRGLLGATISGTTEETKLEAANFLVRIWKTLTDSFSREKRFRFNKSIPIIGGDYIRLSHQVGENVKILDKGCAMMIEKLDRDEMDFFHAMLGKTDRESLKRIVQLLETNFKYTGRA